MSKKCNCDGKCGSQCQCSIQDGAKGSKEAKSCLIKNSRIITIEA